VFIAEFVRISDPAERIESLTTCVLGFVSGNLTTPAGQIDALRAGLVSKGIDVAEQGQGHAVTLA
jgi:hypothetical protein